MSGKLAVVSGANRGMGLETARQLAQRGYRVVLTSRNPDRGQAARARLQQEGLDVDFQVLDVCDVGSIQALAQYIKKHYKKLDVLVNNAGVLLETLDTESNRNISAFQVSPETMLQTFRTNTLGPLLLVQALAPLMGNRGCIVNVSSGMGQLQGMNGSFAAYRVSKTGLNALTRILADELRHTRIKVNAVCPGWVRTDMGGEHAVKSVAKGVETTLWLATLPEDGPSGGFYRDMQPIPW